MFSKSLTIGLFLGAIKAQDIPSFDALMSDFGDATGGMNRDQFWTLYQSVDPRGNRNEAMEAFGMADCDRNDYLNRDEFRALYDSTTNPAQRLCGRGSADAAADGGRGGRGGRGGEGRAADGSSPREERSSRHTYKSPMDYWNMLEVTGELMSYDQFRTGYLSESPGATDEETMGAFNYVNGGMGPDQGITFEQFAKFIAEAQAQADAAGGRGGRGDARGDDRRGGDAAGPSMRGGDSRRGGSPLDDYLSGLHGVIEMEVQRRVMEIMGQQNGGMVCKEWMPMDGMGGAADGTAAPADWDRRAPSSSDDWNRQGDAAMADDGSRGGRGGRGDRGSRGERGTDSSGRGGRGGRGTDGSGRGGRGGRGGSSQGGMDGMSPEQIMNMMQNGDFQNMPGMDQFNDAMGEFNNAMGQLNDMKQEWGATTGTNGGW